MTSTTFASFVNKEKLAIEDYGAPVLDTQGSEILVLKGVGEFLSQFRFIKLEVADFES